MNSKDNESSGRSKISDVSRTHGSDRARKGNLEVLRKGFVCKYCGHKKGLSSINIKKCAKCKRWQR